MRRIAQDDGFSLMPGKNCQRMTEHLQSCESRNPGLLVVRKKKQRHWILDY